MTMKYTTRIIILSLLAGIVAIAGFATVLPAAADEARLFGADRTFLYEGIILAREVEELAQALERDTSSSTVRSDARRIRQTHGSIRSDLETAARRKRAELPRENVLLRDRPYGNDRRAWEEMLVRETGERLARETRIYMDQIDSGREEDLRDTARKYMRDLQDQEAALRYAGGYSGRPSGSVAVDKSDLRWPDRDFLQEGVRLANELGDLSDIARGQLRGGDLQRLADRVRDEHRDIQKDLEKIADRKRAVLRTDFGPPMSSRISRGLSDSQFAEMYVKEAVERLEREIALYETQLRSGRESDLRSFARDRINTLASQMETLRRLPRTGSYYDDLDRDWNRDRDRDYGYGNGYGNGYSGGMSRQDRDFIGQAVRLAEETGDLADMLYDRALDSELKDLGKDLRHFYRDTSSDLLKKLSSRSEEPDWRYSPVRPGIGGGPNGERALIDTIRGRIDQQVRLYQDEVRSGSERELTDYAADRIPRFHEHLDRLQRLRR